MAPKKTGKKSAPKSKKPVKKGSKKAPVKKAPKKSTGKKTAPTKAVKAPKVKAELKSVQPKGAYLTKSELLNNMCAETGLSKKEGKAVFESLVSIGSVELNKGRKFVFPGMARFVVKKRAATKERKGINPFTREPCIFKAKPAAKTVKAYAVKAFKTL